MASRRIYRNFTKGTMNKQLDERLVPDGQYIDALNVRIDATESANASVVKPTKGNDQILSLTTKSGNSLLSQYTTCVGSVADHKTGFIYWMIHCSNYNENKLDMIVGINTRKSNDLKYVVQSQHASRTALNFSPERKITAINIIDGTMYFTDGYNQPRQIILNKTYPDNVTEGELLVIKAPPSEAPLVTPVFASSDESFMMDKVYCFAYRYKYSNGQYSATSQFSLPSIYPGVFSMDDDDSTNAGMRNMATGVVIRYNSGPDSVSDIELLFKYADSSDIFVITKLNKRKLGIGNNKIESFDFNEERYVSVLPEYEILRMFDNVPIKALAQAYMSSRLLYGSYSDGFNMIDKNGYNCNIDFSARAISTELKRQNGHVTSSGTYTLQGPASIPNATIRIDLSGVSLVAGTMIVVQMELTNVSISMAPPILDPLENIPDVQVSYSIVLKASYNSAYEFATSAEFKEAIGTSGNVNKDLTQNTGGTFTDAFTAAMQKTIFASGSGDAYDKYSFGVSALFTPAATSILSGSSVVDIQIPAMVYKSSTGGLGYLYYSISESSVVVHDIVYQKSLHSNRDYQVGIVYMDEYGRSIPALTSNSSSFFLDASKSTTRNQIEVTIPQNQIAPAFASRYKFAIKEVAGNYETVYSNFFFKDPASRFAYFLLNGENARKITEDVALIVKSDSYGPTRVLVQAKVLSKETLTEGQILDDAPAGTYMKLSTENLNIVDSEVFTNGKISDVADSNSVGVILGSSQDLPKVKYALNNGTDNIAIPQSGAVSIEIRTSRIGDGPCEQRAFSFEKTITASRSYTDFMKFWEGEGLDALLKTGSFTVGDPEAPDLKNVYYPGVSVDGVYRAYTRAEVNANIEAWVGANYIHNNFYYFVTDGGLLSMEFWGVRMCPGIFNVGSRKSIASIDFKIYQTGAYLFIFETEPAKQNIDIFYESSQSFAIDRSTGYHLGNEADQTLSSPAVISLDDFNCICFGNGVESFKMKDSLTGRRIYIGSRALSSSYNDVKEADRFADITYSGVYNDETNVDKLNQFVSGLLNFKNLESSFGRINVLSGRKTDVMVIQEDRVSYILVGKNLLSDSVDGGSVASVPEVLGTQIARLEEYGTVNPESYSNHGGSHLFVDQRRGAVIRINGTNYQNDEMIIVSDMDMRSWFDDELESAKDTVILSGYDPGNDEFVLSMTGVSKPIEIEQADCGSSEIITINPGEVFSKNYIIEKGFGTVDVFVRVKTNEAGVMYVSCTDIAEPVPFGNNTSNTLGISISNPASGIVNITIEGETAAVEAEVYLEVGCLQPQEMTITQYVITSNDDEGKIANLFYRYKKGSYISPDKTNSVAAKRLPVLYPVSFYSRKSGIAGNAEMPPIGSTLYFGSTPDSNSPLAFNLADFGLSNTIKVWETNIDDASAFDVLSNGISLAVEVGTDGSVFSSYTMIGENTTNLYVMYDFRRITKFSLRGGPFALPGELCCDDIVFNDRFLNARTLSQATGLFSFPTAVYPAEDGVYSDGETVISIENSVISSISDCPLCSLACGSGTLSIEDMEIGAYVIPINTLGKTGLMRIRMNFDAATQWAIGARAIGPDGKVYSTIYAIAWGDGAVSPNDPTKPMFFGKNYDACSVPGEYTLNEYQYSAGDITPTGNVRTINVTADQIELHSTVESFGFSIVVPIFSDKDARVVLELYALCAGMTFNVTPICADFLPAIATRLVTSLPCDAVSLVQTRYLAMRGSSVAVKDVLFNDIYGSVPAAAGTYRYSAGYFTIGDAGQITAITACTVIGAGAQGFLSTSDKVTEISACKTQPNILYYESGGDGIVTVGDTIYTDPYLTTKLLDSGRTVGTYKYGTGFMVVGANSVVTAVSSTCDSPIPSVIATAVSSSRKTALQSTTFGLVYYTSTGTGVKINSVMYLDSSMSLRVAEVQGGGFMYLPDTGQLLIIDLLSRVTSIEIINFEEL